VRRLSAEEVTGVKLAELRLASTCDSLLSTGALAAALRRVAGLACPCSPQTLLRSVTRPLEWIAEDAEALAQHAQETLDDLLALGDLIESQEHIDGNGSSRRRIIYAAQPAFVARPTGAAILLGVAPDGASPLTQEILERVEATKHVRRLPRGDNELHAKLRRLGLLEMSETAWLKCPQPEAAKQYLARFDAELDKAPPSGSLPELEILDPSTAVAYYRGRWSTPKRRDGRFVARRKQAYGANLWCYVELASGEPERFVDLPMEHSRWRAWDEAWRLQMAIDACRGQPQQFRVEAGPEAALVEFFSPIPSWARRRLDAIGGAVDKKGGCLFAYSIPREDVDDEVRFADQMLWLRCTA
jgi:hypothetical protein